MVLLYLIMVGLALVMLESMQEIEEKWGTWLRTAEWCINGLFTAEYLVHLGVYPKPLHYATSFFGIVDLLAIVPTYPGILIPSAGSLTLVRAMPHTRVIRILNLLEYVREARLLLLALLASRHRIIVFMLAALAMVIVFGAIMFVVDTPESGFTSIPRSIYWAIATLTTVGYSDCAGRGKPL